MSENTTPTNAEILAMFGPPARPADWKAVDEDKLYEGPEFRERRTEWGVKLMWTPDGYRFGLSSDTNIDIMTKTDLQCLRSSIEQALRAENKID